MIRICTKRHAETRRFKDTTLRFHPHEMDKALREAEAKSRTEFMVQIQNEPTFYTGWHEVKTIINTKNALLH